MNKGWKKKWPAVLIAALLVISAQSPSAAAPAESPDNNSVINAKATNGVLLYKDNPWEIPTYYMMPGKPYVQTVKLANLLTIPQPITVRLSIKCRVKSSNPLIGTVPFTIIGEEATVIVPGDPGVPVTKRGLRPMRTLTLKADIPSKCVMDTPVLGGLRSDGIGGVGIAVPGFDEWGMSTINLLLGKAHTRANARFNLALKTGQDSVDYQAHHTMPYAFEPIFTRYGINIHDPYYLIWWCSRSGVLTNHPSNSSAYNQKWKSFLDKPGLTKKSILQFREQIMSEYKYTCP